MFKSVELVHIWQQACKFLPREQPKKLFLFGVLLAITLAVCIVFQDEKTEETKPVSTALTALHPLPISQPPVPTGLQSVAGFHHTAYMGTADHPTIDGGMINAADGTLITQDRPTIPEPVPESSPLPAKVGAAVPSASTSLTAAGFDDAWATSERVKRLLKQAASNGKLDYVLQKSTEMQLPASVAVVPMVESSYQTNAVSPKGAGGPWQIMPRTAQDYGITSSQRFEWEPATKAALTLLNDLHREFNSWDLAFAAYNAGSKRVQDALHKNPKAHSVQELDLPIETKQYVNRIRNINHVLAQYSLEASNNAS